MIIYVATDVYVHICMYIHRSSKYVFSWLLYIHTWRNMVGIWSMFDVFVPTYVHVSDPFPIDFLWDIVIVSLYIKAP